MLDKLLIINLHFISEKTGKIWQKKCQLQIQEKLGKLMELHDAEMFLSKTCCWKVAWIMLTYCYSISIFL